MSATSPRDPAPSAAAEKSGNFPDCCNDTLPFHGRGVVESSDRPSAKLPATPIGISRPVQTDKSDRKIGVIKSVDDTERASPAVRTGRLSVLVAGLLALVFAVMLDVSPSSAATCSTFVDTDGRTKMRVTGIADDSYPKQYRIGTLIKASGNGICPSFSASQTSDGYNNGDEHDFVITSSTPRSAEIRAHTDYWTYKDANGKHLCGTRVVDNGKPWRGIIMWGCDTHSSRTVSFRQKGKNIDNIGSVWVGFTEGRNADDVITFHLDTLVIDAQLQASVDLYPSATPNPADGSNGASVSVQLSAGATGNEANSASYRWQQVSSLRDDSIPANPLQITDSTAKTATINTAVMSDDTELYFKVTATNRAGLSTSAYLIVLVDVLAPVIEKVETDTDTPAMDDFLRMDVTFNEDMDHTTTPVISFPTMNENAGSVLTQIVYHLSQWQTARTYKAVFRVIDTLAEDVNLTDIDVKVTSARNLTGKQVDDTKADAFSLTIKAGTATPFASITVPVPQFTSVEAPKLWIHSRYLAVVTYSGGCSASRVTIFHDQEVDIILRRLDPGVYANCKIIFTRNFDGQSVEVDIPKFEIVDRPVFLSAKCTGEWGPGVWSYFGRYFHVLFSKPVKLTDASIQLDSPGYDPITAEKITAQNITNPIIGVRAADKGKEYSIGWWFSVERLHTTIDNLDLVTKIVITTTDEHGIVDEQGAALHPYRPDMPHCTAAYPFPVLKLANIVGIGDHKSPVSGKAFSVELDFSDPIKGKFKPRLKFFDGTTDVTADLVTDSDATGTYSHDNTKYTVSYTVRDPLVATINVSRVALADAVESMPESQKLRPDNPAAATRLEFSVAENVAPTIIDIYLDNEILAPGDRTNLIITFDEEMKTDDVDPRPVVSFPTDHEDPTSVLSYDDSSDVTRWLSPTIFSASYVVPDNISDPFDLADIDVSITTAEDLAGNTIDHTYPDAFSLKIIEKHLPKVSSVLRYDPTSSQTTADSVTWRVTFNTPVMNVDGSDFQVISVPEGLSNLSITVAQPDQADNKVYDVTVSGGGLPDFEGEIKLVLADDQNIQDLSNYDLDSKLPIGSDYQTYVIDQSLPTILSVLRKMPLASPTDWDEVTWRVTFDRPVKNVDGADFRIVSTPGGLSGLSITVAQPVQADNKVYDVKVSGGGLPGFEGEIKLVLADDQNIQDLSNYDLDSKLPIGNDYQTYVIDQVYVGVTVFGLADDLSGAADQEKTCHQKAWALRHSRKINGGDNYSESGAPVDVFTYYLLDGSNIVLGSKRFTRNAGTTDYDVEPFLKAQQDLIGRNPGNWRYILFDNNRNDRSVEYSAGEEFPFGLLNVNPTENRIRLSFEFNPGKYNPDCPSGSDKRILSIVRQNPHDDNTDPDGQTDADSLTWRVTFNGAVRDAGGDALDGDNFPVSGLNGRQVITIAAVVNIDNVYDVKVDGGGLDYLNGKVTLGFVGITDNLGRTIDYKTLPQVDQRIYTMVQPNSPFGQFGCTGSFEHGTGRIVYSVAKNRCFVDGSVERLIAEPSIGDLWFRPNNQPEARADIATTLDGRATVLIGDSGFSVCSIPYGLSQRPGKCRFDGGAQSALGEYNVLFEWKSPHARHKLSAVVSANGAGKFTFHNGNVVSTSTEIAPRISSIVRHEPHDDDTDPDGLTAADSLTWRVTFNKDVQDLGGGVPDGGNFPVTGLNGDQTITVSKVANLDNTYDVTVAGGDPSDPNGEVTLGFADITDNLHQSLDTSTAPSPNQVTYTLDPAPPTIISITRNSPDHSPTNADRLTWRVVFNKDVQDSGGGALTSANFPVSGTTATIKVVNDPEGDGSSATYDSTLSDGDLVGMDGTVGLGFTGIFGRNGLALDLAVDPTPDERDFQIDNSEPMAHAGPDQAVGGGADVTLEGEVSGHTSFAWLQVDGENSHTAATSGECHLGDIGSWTLGQTFGAPAAKCKIHLLLTASDSVHDAAEDWITISVDNPVPTANAGLDQVVGGGAEVTLEGVVSGHTSFAWLQVDGENSHTEVTSGPCHLATLSDPTKRAINFTAPDDGCDLYMRLTAVDGHHADVFDWVKITVDVSAPRLLEETPVPPKTADSTPEYTFSVSESGDLSIAYGGSCNGSPTTLAGGADPDAKQEITATLSADGQGGALADGIHADCTVTVTDAFLNTSEPLEISEFGIDTTAPTVTEITTNPTGGPVAQAPGGRVLLTVTFSEAMDQQTLPTISLAGSGDNALSELEFAAADSYWVSPTSYVASYTVAAAAGSVDDIKVTVEDATDLAGNPVDHSLDKAFSLSVINQEVSVRTTRLYFDPSGGINNGDTVTRSNNKVIVILETSDQIRRKSIGGTGVLDEIDLSVHYINTVALFEQNPDLKSVIGMTLNRNNGDNSQSPPYIYSFEIDFDKAIIKQIAVQRKEINIIVDNGKYKYESDNNWNNESNTLSIYFDSGPSGIADAKLIDRTGPVFDSTNPSPGDAVSVEVTFLEEMDVNDFPTLKFLEGGGINRTTELVTDPNATGAWSGGGKVYTVDYRLSGSGSGQFRVGALEVVGTARDAAGYDLTDRATGLEFTFGDTIAPKIDAVVASDDNPAPGEPFSLTITFDEAMNQLTTPLVSFPEANKDITTVMAFDAAGSRWTSPSTYVAAYQVNDSLVETFRVSDVNVKVETAEDLFGNPIRYPVKADAFSLTVAENTKPTVLSIVPEFVAVNINAAFKVTIVFSENVSFSRGGLAFRTGGATEDGDPALVGNADNFGMGKTYEVTLTSSGLDDIIIGVLADAAFDAAGNGNSASGDLTASVRINDLEPTANAGLDQTVAAGADVKLSAKASHHTSIAWLQVDDENSDNPVTSGDCILADISSWTLEPTFKAPAVDCEIYLRLTASDGFNADAVSWVKVTVDATAPDVSVTNFEIPGGTDNVKLAYTSSADDIASTKWVEVTDAAGNTEMAEAKAVPLHNADSRGKAKFDAPDVAAYTNLYFRVTVTDKVGNETSIVMIVTIIENTAPEIDSATLTDDNTDPAPGEEFSVAITFTEPMKDSDRPALNLLDANGNPVTADLVGEPDMTGQWTANATVYTVTYQIHNVLVDSVAVAKVELDGTVHDKAGNPLGTGPDDNQASLAFTVIDSPPHVSARTAPPDLVAGGKRFKLIAEPTTDSDGVPLDKDIKSYLWQQIGGSSVTGFGKDDKKTVGVTAPENVEETLTFQVTVTDRSDNQTVVDVSIAVDGVAPTVEIKNAPSAADPLVAFEITVEFSEPVIDFRTGDIDITNGDATNLRSVGTDGDKFDIDIIPDGSGDVSISIAADIAHDGAGNGNEAFAPVLVTLNDVIAPEVVSVSRNRPAQELTNSGSMTFEVTFSEPIKLETIKREDFVIARGSGVSDGSVTGVVKAGSDERWLVKFEGVAGAGTVGLAIASDATIEDEAGNQLDPAATIASAETYQLDKVKPVIVSILRHVPDDTQTEPDGRTNADHLTWRVTFSEPVKDVSPSSFKMVRNALNQPTITVVRVKSIVDEVYDVSVSGGGLADRDGQVTLTLGENEIRDLAGNKLDANIAPSPNNVKFMLDNTAPDIAVSEIVVAGNTKNVDLVYLSKADDIVSTEWVEVTDSSGTREKRFNVAVPLRDGDQKVAKFDAPDVAVDTLLYFRVTLIDNAGNSTSAVLTATVTDSTAPKFSVADFSVKSGTEGVKLKLKSSANDIETIVWTQVTDADGAVKLTDNPVELSDTDTATAKFDAPDVAVETPLYFRVTVTDQDDNESRAVLTVTVTYNAPPDLSVTDFEVKGGSTGVELTYSSAAGDIASTEWVEVTEASGRRKKRSSDAVLLRHGDKAMANFDAPDVAVDTPLYFRVTLKDRHGNETQAVLTVTVTDNIAPDVSVTDFDVKGGTAGVELSFDSDAVDIEKIDWVELSTPRSETPKNKPTVGLRDADQMTAEFDAPNAAADKKLYFRVTVTDDQGNTTIAVLTVTVTDNIPPRFSVKNFTVTGLRSYIPFEKDFPDDSIVSIVWVETTDVTGLTEKTENPVKLQSGDGGSFFVVPTVTEDTLLFFRGTAADAAGNTTIAVLTVTVTDNTTPSVTGAHLTDANTNPAPGETFSVAVTFSEPMDKTDKPQLMFVRESTDVSGNLVTDRTVTGRWDATQTVYTVAYTISDQHGLQNPATSRVLVAGSVHDKSGNLLDVTAGDHQAFLFLNIADKTAPQLTLSATPDLVKGGGRVTLEAKSAADDIRSYSWRQTGGTAVKNINRATTAAATVTAPDNVEETLTFEVTVVDNSKNVTKASVSFDVDGIAPTVTITAPKNPVVTRTSIRAAPVTVTIEFSELVVGFDIADIKVNAGQLSKFSQQNETTYEILLVPDGLDDVTISIRANAAVDRVDNGNVASDVITIPVIDGAAPYLVSASLINLTDASRAKLPLPEDEISVSVKFDEPMDSTATPRLRFFYHTGPTRLIRVDVSGRAVTDPHATGVWSDDPVYGVDSVYTVNYVVAAVGATPVSVHTVEIKARDKFKNWLADDSATELEFTIDSLGFAPVVQSILRHDPAAEITNADFLVFAVTFSQPLREGSVDRSDFVILAGPGIVNARIKNLELLSTDSRDAQSWLVTVDGAAGKGSVGLGIADDARIENTERKSLELPAVPATSESYLLDTINPTVAPVQLTIVNEPSRRGTNVRHADRISIAVTFDKAMDQRAKPKLSFWNGSTEVTGKLGLIPAGRSWSNAGGGDIYTAIFDIDRRKGGDSVSITDIAIANAFDTLKNPLWQGPYELEFTVLETIAPRLVDIHTLAQKKTNSGSLIFTVHFSEAIDPTTIGVDDFVIDKGKGISGGIISRVERDGSDSVWQVTVTDATGEGTVGIRLAGDAVIKDQNGNFLASSVPIGDLQHYELDQVVPTVELIERQWPEQKVTNANALTWRVTFSEPVENVDPSSFDEGGSGPNGRTISISKVDEAIYDVTVTGVELEEFDGDITIKLAGAQAITDAVGNPLDPTLSPGPENWAFTLDNIAPDIGVLDIAVKGDTSNVALEFTSLADDIAGYSWVEVTDRSGSNEITSETVAILNANRPKARFHAPSDVTVDLSLFFRVTLTDNAGNQALAVLKVTVTENQLPVVTGAALAGQYSQANPPVAGHEFAVVVEFSEAMDRTDTPRLKFFDGSVDVTKRLVQDPSVQGKWVSKDMQYLVTYAVKDPLTSPVTVTKVVVADAVRDLRGNPVDRSRDADEAPLNFTVAENVPPHVVSASRSAPGTDPLPGGRIAVEVVFSEPLARAGPLNLSFFEGDSEVTDRLLTGKLAARDWSWNPTRTTYTVNYDLNDPLDVSIKVTRIVVVSDVEDIAGNLMKHGGGDDQAALSFGVTENTLPLVIVTADGPGRGGESGSLDATGSSDASGIASYQWSQVAGPGSDQPASDLVVDLDTSYPGFAKFTLPDTDVSATLYFRLTVTDKAGNSTVEWISYDVIENTDPQIVSITRHDPATEATTSNRLVFEVTFSEAVDPKSVDIADFAIIYGQGVSNGEITRIASDRDNIVWQVTAKGAGGEGTVGLGMVVNAAIRDLTGNQLDPATVPKSELYSLDRSRPSIVSVVRLQPASETTNDDTLTWQVTFSEPVQVGADSFRTNLSEEVIQVEQDASGTVYDVTVQHDGLKDHDGTVKLNFVSRMITDLLLNPLDSSVTPEPNEVSYTLDNTGPTVRSITALGSASTNADGNKITNANEVMFAVEFSEPLNPATVDAADFAVALGAGISSATVSSVEPGGTDLIWHVTVADIAGDGSLALQVSDQTDIEDAVGNSLVAAKVRKTSRFEIDQTDPEIVSITRHRPSDAETEPDGRTNADTLVFLATFSEAVVNVDASDFEVNYTGTPDITAAITNVTGESANFTYEITVSGGGLDGFNGTVGLDLATSHNIADIGGNPLPKTQPVTDQTYTLDNKAPSLNPVKIASNNTDDTSIARTGDEVTLSFTSDEQLTVDKLQVTLLGQSGSNVTLNNTSGNIWTATVTVTDAIPDGDGVAEFTIKVTDDFGNGPTTVTETTDASQVRIDRVVPTVTEVVTVPNPTSDPMPNVVIKSTEIGDVSYGGACQGNVSELTAANQETTITLEAAGGGDLKDNTTYSDCEVTVTDKGGNAGSKTLTSFTVDQTAPTLASFTRLEPSVETTNANTLVFLATFSEAVVNVDASDFEVTGTTATITNVTGESADFTYEITVSDGDLDSFNGTVGLNLATSHNITDSGGNPLPNTQPVTDQTYTLDNNDAPSITSNGGGDAAEISVDENQTQVTNVESSDPDGETENGGGLTYSLTTNNADASADNAKFDLDTATGVLTFISAPDFDDPGDSDGQNDYQVEVTVTDSGGLTDSQAITVRVLDVDEIPPGLTISTDAVDGATGGPFVAIFTFEEDVTGFTAGDIKIDHGKVSELSPKFSKDTFADIYTAIITPSTGRVGTITITVADAVATDEAGNGNLGDTITVDYVDKEFIEIRTSGIIRKFIARRADIIVANQPVVNGRMSDSDTDQFEVSSEFTDRHASFNLDFAASLRSQMNRNEEKQVHAVPAGPIDSKKDVWEFDDSRFDIWVKGSYSWSKNDTAEDEVGLLFLGADMRLNKDLVIGLLGQVDWTLEKDDAVHYEVTGTGWMVGPYLVARPHKNLIFDARASWGMSDNEITPFTQHTETYKGDIYSNGFDTRRWYAKAQLTGDFDVGRFNIKPHVAVHYFEEVQDAYKDHYGIEIDSQTVSLGRLTFGPKLSTSFYTDIGLVLAPHIAVTGIWDFDTGDTGGLESGVDSGKEEIRARAEGGFDLRAGSSGVSLNLSGFYDGIGIDDHEAWGGDARLVIPLQGN